ncbi:MAG: hypothetical protein JWQ20_126 [Conexibacter sp.]|nr:hypothetical protein [Conexibacter sp.]
MTRVSRLFLATNLWHLRPLLAAVMILVALVAVMAGTLRRGRTATALAVAAVTIIVAVDALAADRVRWLIQLQYAYRVRPSAWALLPVTGGLLLCVALLHDKRVPWMGRKPVADGGNRGSPERRSVMRS